MVLTDDQVPMGAYMPPAKSYWVMVDALAAELAGLSLGMAMSTQRLGDLGAGLSRDFVVGMALAQRGADLGPSRLGRVNVAMLGP